MIVVFFFHGKKLFCNMSAIAEVKTVSDLETRLSEIQILWDEIAPVIIQEMAGYLREKSGDFARSPLGWNAICYKLTNWECDHKTVVTRGGEKLSVATMGSQIESSFCTRMAAKWKSKKWSNVRQQSKKVQ